MLGQMELLLIGGVVILLFGSKKLPELMKGLGSGMKEFKKAQSDVEDEVSKPTPSFDKKNETASKS
ncbi:MAG: twin-arginine translocase TatA/TatE family subunit [Chlorobiaceae bacterium]|nr:twin-arginine translocase TatA/TatE family subunit [Chlorobiaceae bacterium]